MKKNIATKWVKALRSGKYKQAYGRLHSVTPGGFCCLGVLCKTYEKDYEEMDKHLTDSFTLPFSVMEDFNIASSVCSQEKGMTIGKKQYHSLAGANDNYESFANIADWIETNYALL